MTDLRNAVRALRATLGFTMVALLVLTLGIGATTAIFSVVDAVVLRGLSFDAHDRSSVMSMVLSSAGLLLVAGLALGTAGAWYLRATAKTFLFGLDAADPRAFAAAIVSLSVAVLVASIIPARRAASVDPVVALRAE